MTHEEAIRVLSELIVYLQGYSAGKDNPQNMKNNVLCNLNKIDVADRTKCSIMNIEVSNYSNNPLSYIVEVQEMEKEIQSKNKQSIQSMIEILKVEQERHKRILIEEEKQKAMEEQAKNLELQERAIAEQKVANRISKRALWFSAIATIASVIATVISIIALYK